MAEVYDDRVNRSDPTRYIKRRVSDIAPTLDDDDDDPTSKRKHLKKIKPAVLTSVVAGAFAGVVADVTLYPLDTLKTRLQSKEGFRASGGFRKVYKGIVPVLLTSAPISGLFFATYNTTINTLRTDDSNLNPFVYLAAAGASETIGATLRVPLDIVKLRKQTSNSKSTYIIKRTLKTEGIRGFYRGFLSTLMREIPFALIQFPLWEYMINQLIIYQNGQELTPLQTAYCGAAAGAIAAAITTPVDVVKTRIMLEDKEKIEKYKPNVNYNIAKEVYRQKGVKGLFAGFVPRILWIMFGGFIYFGAYEKAKVLCEQYSYLFSKKPPKHREVSPTYSEEKLETFNFANEGKRDKSEQLERNETQEKSEDKKRLKEEEEEMSTENQNVIDISLVAPDSFLDRD